MNNLTTLQFKDSLHIRSIKLLPYPLRYSIESWHETKLIATQKWMSSQRSHYTILILTIWSKTEHFLFCDYFKSLRDLLQDKCVLKVLQCNEIEQKLSKTNNLFKRDLMLWCQVQDSCALKKLLMILTKEEMTYDYY